MKIELTPREYARRPWNYGLRGDPLERLRRGYTVDRETGCHVWWRAKNSAGYGKTFGPDGKGVHSHILAWVLKNGAVPIGMELDHLCRNRSCCNPDHLEPVTHRENSLRSSSPTALNARKTHCDNGHEFTEENTRRRGYRHGRVCRTCERERMRRLRAAKRASAS